MHECAKSNKASALPETASFSGFCVNQLKSHQQQISFDDKKETAAAAKKRFPISTIDQTSR